MRVGGDDDEHGGAAVPTARDAGVDVGEELLVESLGGEVAPAGYPGLLGQVVDARLRRPVTDDDEHPGLTVLRARRERRRVEDRRDRRVVEVAVGELPTGALPVDDVEEVAHLPEPGGTRSPTSENVFTYMMRSASCQPQCWNSPVPCTPNRPSTSGVISLYECSGSSVSIS